MASLEKSPVLTAKPSVTAGFKCASALPQAIAVKTPVITANAHPVVITIQPAPSALLFLSRTLATTPLPIRMRTSVPMNSPKKFDVICALEPVERSRNRLLPQPVQLLPPRRFHLRFPGMVHAPAAAQVRRILKKSHRKSGRVGRSQRGGLLHRGTYHGAIQN